MSPADSQSDSPTGGAAARDPRRSTATSSFGAGRREGHDASAFYARFTPPSISTDDHVVVPADRPVNDALLHGTAEELLADDTHVRDDSVALVVTSPPYFVGKSYEEAMGQGHVPAEYSEHLANLHRVFERCVAKLEPGGRIAVNVANLGRRPYRSQAADIVRIFEDLGLLVRGEIIWKKGEGSNGSTAWGSFQKPSNPVFRDITERIIVASKGRFDRAIPSRQRAERGLPSVGSITKEAFMRDTKDVWEIAPESATRVGHPAPFPIALPGRLIELYTYYDDLVLDPYMGSGTTAVAAVRTQRNFVGCESEAAYIEAATARIAAEREALATTEEQRIRVVVPATRGGDTDAPVDARRRAVREGAKADEIAELVLAECGFTSITRHKKLRCGVEIDLVATAADGSTWHFDVAGAHTSERAGLRRTDALWRALGKAGVRAHDESKIEFVPFVLLTTALPTQGVGLRALRTALEGELIKDAIPMLDEIGQARLREYGTRGLDHGPLDVLAADEPDALF